jgi:hypothetical protein
MKLLKIIYKNMIGRPKISNKKENISLSIDIELINILNKYLENKNMTISEYIEILLKKESELKNDKRMFRNII